MGPCSRAPPSCTKHLNSDSFHDPTTRLSPGASGSKNSGSYTRAIQPSNKTTSRHPRRRQAISAHNTANQAWDFPTCPRQLVIINRRKAIDSCSQRRCQSACSTEQNPWGLAHAVLLQCNTHADSFNHKGRANRRSIVRFAERLGATGSRSAGDAQPQLGRVTKTNPTPRACR